MAVTLVTTSPASSGSSPGSGRNIYPEGNRLVGRVNIALTGTYVTGGFAFDPVALFGWPTTVAEVRLSPHILVANVALLRYRAAYDFVNKKVLLFDVTDGDEPNGDTVTGLAFDVVVVSE